MKMKFKRQDILLVIAGFHGGLLSVAISMKIVTILYSIFYLLALTISGFFKFKSKESLMQIGYIILLLLAFSPFDIAAFKGNQWSCGFAKARGSSHALSTVEKHKFYEPGVILYIASLGVPTMAAFFVIIPVLDDGDRPIPFYIFEELGLKGIVEEYEEEKPTTR